MGQVCHANAMLVMFLWTYFMISENEALFNLTVSFPVGQFVISIS